MKELEVLFEQYKNKELKWLPALQILNQLQNEKKIILYAGTYSFDGALKYPLCDSAQFYFYDCSARSGYCFYINPMGVGIVVDNDIFKFSHRRLYNKNHLSACALGGKDMRSGEYFNRKN